MSRIRNVGGWLALILAASGCARDPGTAFFKTTPIAARPVWTGTAPVLVKASRGSGRTLLGWYWAPADPGKPLLIFYPGRFGNRDTAAEQAQSFATEGRGVLVASYTGYGDNGGVPTERALYADGTAFLALSRTLSPGSRTYLFGDGLGSAVALHTAIGESVAGVATLGAFDRLSSFAPTMSLGGYAGQFDNLTNIARVSAPVLLFHGRQDEVVPFAMAEKLRRAGGRNVHVVPIAGESYHSINLAYIAPVVWQALAAVDHSPAP